MEGEDGSGPTATLPPAIGRVRCPQRAAPVVEATAASHSKVPPMLEKDMVRRPCAREDERRAGDIVQR